MKQLASDAPSYNQESTPQFISPLQPLHEAILKVNAYQFLDDRRRELTRKYLTTLDSMSDLRPAAGVTAYSAISYLINTSIETIWPHLPPDVQEQYKSPTEALRLKTSLTLPNTRRRRSEALTGNQREFSQDHKLRLSEAALRRWKRYRETKVRNEAP